MLCESFRNAIWILICAASVSIAKAQTLVINEISSCGEDWIELYNPSVSEISTVDLYLSDDPTDLQKWEIPAVEVGSLEFLLITGEDDGYNEFETNFKLKCSGESLFLSNGSGLILDQFEAISLSEGISFGRCPDGSGHIGKLRSSSIGSSNAGNNLLVFSNLAGFYSEDQALEITNSNSNDTIRFTTDGSLPTSQSEVYDGAISISDRSDEPNELANIQAGISDHIVPPTVIKATTIRAASFQDGVISSEIRTATYFTSIEEIRSGLDVISITLDSASLFNLDSGIYLAGNHFEPDTPNWTGNYFQRGRDWERLANVEYFNSEGNTVFNQLSGIRIHGESSRRNRQKSLRIYARNDYQAKYFGTSLIEGRKTSEYKNLILRSGFADRNRTLFKDLLSARIAQELDFGVSLGKPVIVFLNGEYWGIHELRERVDEHYIESNFGVDGDELDLLSGNAELNPLLNGEIHNGDNEGWEDVVNHVSSYNLNDDERYDQLSEMINMSSLIDYYAAEIFFNNHDWPKKNYRLWRNTDPIETFQFILHDLDAGWGFQDPSYNMIEHSTTMNSAIDANPPYANRLFYKLLENEHFVNSFLDRLACLMIKEFESSVLKEAIHQLYTEYEPSIELHWDRWYQNDLSAWNDSIQEVLIDFAESRHQHVIHHVESHFGIDFNPELRCLFSGYQETPQPPNEIMVYPNPTDEDCELLLPSNRNNWSVLVQDQLGRIQSQLQANAQVKIETTDWPNGVYFVSARSTDQVFTTKLVVQH